jgi:AcrR family transcriptional regulator
MDSALDELWGAERRPRRGPQPRFTVTEVAAAAVCVADREGLRGLALASVAAQLGLTTTGLYRYVDSKDTLVEIAVDEAIGPAPRITAEDWRDGVRQWSRLLFEVYRSHPWLSDVRPTGVPRTPNALAWIESFLVAVEGAADIADPMSASLFVQGVVRMYAEMLGSVQRSDADDVAELAARLSRYAAGRFPRLAQTVRRDWSNVVDEFEFAIDTVLRGLTEPRDPAGRGHEPTSGQTASR